MLILNFISEEIELNLIDKIKFEPYNPDINTRNHIKRYGNPGVHEFSEYDPIIPDYLEYFRQFFDFHTITVNQYHPGQKMNPHVDTLRADNEIRILSIISSETMWFRNVHDKNDVIPILLPQRSLFLMKDDLRYKYEHYLIASAKRISIVFRSYYNKKVS